MIRLGQVPAGMTVRLVEDGPLVGAVTFDAAVPAAPVLHFSDGTTWEATLSGDSSTASWLKTAAEVAGLIDAHPHRVSLRSPVDGQVYASGSVRVERVPGGTPSTVVPSGGSITVDTVDGVVQVTYNVGGDASPEGIQDVVGAMIVAAGGTYDDEAGTITLPSTGGDTTVQIGTVTLPESPTPGLSVSVLADSSTVLPEGITWDSGGEPTITERMLLVFVWSGDDWVGTYGPSIPDAPVPPDETGPTAGTLGVVVDVTSADGTVTGAADETELDAAPYSFRIDAGTWSAYQAGATYEWTGLDPDTPYDFQHRVRDAAGNVTEGAVVTDTTDADTTGPTAGTLGVVPGVTTADLTVTGASDDIALHATPYAYSTNNGSTWSAYQAGATYEATGLTADTSYTFRHKVRDAAGNETVGAAVTDSTDPDPTDVTPPTPGTLAASAITSDSFTLTVTGASDDEALHAQPYRFSTDDGATYSAWQAGATFDATGLDPETEYTCVHQVRDAALNVATGSSILVETEAEASGWTPADLSGLVAWYDADDTATITDAGSGAVSQWSDKSGNARHVTQALALGRPVTGTRTLNGRNVIDFGGNDVLTVTGVTVSQPYTVAWVGAYDGLTLTHVAVSLANLNAYGPYKSDGTWRIYNGTALNSAVSVDADAHTFVGIANGASSILRLDGSQIASGNAGATAGSRVNVGHYNGTQENGAFDGVMGELVIVAGALSGADLIALEEYLSAKWATTP